MSILYITNKIILLSGFLKNNTIQSPRKPNDSHCAATILQRQFHCIIFVIIWSLTCNTYIFSSEPHYKELNINNILLDIPRRLQLFFFTFRLFLVYTVVGLTHRCLRTLDDFMRVIVFDASYGYLISILQRINELQVKVLKF